MLNLRDFKVIDRYQIIKKLGQGSSGVVYLGRDPYIERNVAIKIYPLPRDASPEKIRGYRKSFFSEAQSAGRLLHPNIVAIYDADLFQDLCYIAMEYIEGSPLEKFCEPDHLLSLEKIIKIVFRVCRGLEYAHRKGVIHRDIKPSNIIVGSGGHVKITDFSIAYVKRSQSTLVQGLFGSPSYMSPEQVKEEDITEKTDIFSLGSVLYELLAGKKAFEGENEYSTMYKIVNEEPVSIMDSRPDFPENLHQIISRAMAKDPAQRYRSGLEFAYDLRQALRELRHSGGEGQESEFNGYAQDLPFFDNFTQGQINEIFSACNLIKVPDGETIIKEGDIDDSFYILISGEVTVLKGKEDVAVLGKGECFGEMAYLTGDPRSATIVSRGECILLQFSATLLAGLPESIQLLFFKNFSHTIIKRLSSH